MNIIEELEKEQIAELETQRAIPVFGPGDTLRVNVKVVEGSRERIQAYEGVCIGRSGQGIHENFTVRKISYGEGVERVFPVYSPLIDSIDVVRRGRVRRAKLYYLRGRRGKSARIPERTDARSKKAQKERFRGFKKPRGERDGLTRINGIGDELEKRLNKIGIIQYEQIANFTDDDIAKVDEILNFKGRIERDDWIGQAKELFLESTADEVPEIEDEATAAAPEGEDGGEEQKPAS